MKKITISQIKDVEEILAWGDELMRRDSEVQETLEKENINEECAYIFNIAGTNYLLVIMDSSGEINPSDIELPVNAQHRDIFNRNQIQFYPLKKAYELRRK